MAGEQDKGKILPFRPRNLSPEVGDKVVKARTTDQLLDIMAKISPALQNPEIRERESEK